MITTAEKAVVAIDHHHFEIVNVSFSNFLHIPRELPCLSIVLKSECTNGKLCATGIEHGECFTEDADLCVFNDVGFAAVVASHDVVIQHAFNLPSFLLRSAREKIGAKQTLFFSAKCNEDHSSWK